MRQLILAPRLPSVYAYALTCTIYMSVTVSYRHLAGGLEIASVALPMANRCYKCAYNGLSS